MSNLPKWIVLPRFDGSPEEATFLMERWTAAALAEWQTQKVCLRSKDLRIVNDGIAAIQAAAHAATGFSSLALEMLRRENVAIELREKSPCVMAVIDCAGVVMDGDLERVQENIAGVAKVWKAKLSWCLWWVHAKPLGYDFYEWRNTLPMIQLDNRLLRPEKKSEPGAIFSGVVAEEDDGLGIAGRGEKYLKLCTKGQRPALRALIQLAEVRARNFKSPLELRYNPLLIGLSGSGKSYVCKLFGKVVGLPTFDATIGSWLIKGGSNPNEATMAKIMAALDATPLVLVVDEADKIRKPGPAGDHNFSYFSTIWDELMCLLDFRLDNFGGTEQARRNLKKSWIVAAGAFQDLYRKRIGGKGPLVVEEIETLEPLTYQTVLEEGGLPDELLNRLAAELIEVRPPDLAEHLHMMKAVEKRFGVEMEDSRREEEARESILAMQGMRGLQRHALNAAKAALAIEKAERSKNKT